MWPRFAAMSDEEALDFLQGYFAEDETGLAEHLGWFPGRPRDAVLEMLGMEQYRNRCADRLPYPEDYRGRREPTEQEEHYFEVFSILCDFFERDYHEGIDSPLDPDDGFRHTSDESRGLARKILRHLEAGGMEIAEGRRVHIASDS
jgi:hypothetical protein